MMVGDNHLIYQVDENGLNEKTAKEILDSLQNNTMSGDLAKILLQSIVRKKIFAMNNQVKKESLSRKPKALNDSRP